MTDVQVPAGTVVREVIGADLPAEPPIGTVVIDSSGRFYQRIRWTSSFYGLLSHRVEWTAPGERKAQARPSWMELLNRGPVTIVWRPDPVQDEGESS